VDLESFKSSLAEAQPPQGLSFALLSLWWDAKGDWEKAHEFAQRREDQAGNRVHAYLHRKEGDLSNAGYWYRRCRITMPEVSLEAEWDDLVRGFLAAP
jgi:hypothetical protein